MANFKLISNGKINFGLKVINKRSDNYHNLETIFFPLKLSDKISFSIEKTNSNHNSVIISSNKDFIPLNEKNLCYKAIEKFFVAFNIFEKFDINVNLTKFIPVGGGLGGGSSNAAAILKALIRYFDINVIPNRVKLLKLAASIGSDVPFFMIDKPCFAKARGELLYKLDEFNLNGYSLLVINPGIHVSTKWAFDTLGIKEGEFRKSDLSKVKRFSESNFEAMVNDFEPIVFKKYPELGNIKSDAIESGCDFVSMSGTGASIYCVIKKHKRNERIQMVNKLRSTGYFVYEEN